MIQFGRCVSATVEGSRPEFECNVPFVTGLNRRIPSTFPTTDPTRRDALTKLKQRVVPPLQRKFCKNL